MDTQKYKREPEDMVTRRKAPGRGGTNQEHNCPRSRADLEVDFWKALSKYKRGARGQ